DNAALAWRHFSLCEWFAGLHLAELPTGEQEALLRQHCRDERWQWIIRFALSAAQRMGQSNVVNRLARFLVTYGGVFLAWNAIRSDKINLNQELEQLVRWLVHR